MKFREDKNYMYAAFTGSIIVIVGILFYYLLQNWAGIIKEFGFLISVITPIVIGIIIAYLLNPILNFFEYSVFLPLIRKIKKDNTIKKAKAARGLGIIVTILLFILAIVGFLWMIIPQLYISISSIAKSLPDYYKNIQKFVNEALDHNPEIKNYIGSVTNTSYDKLEHWLTTDVVPNLGNIVLNLSNGVVGGIKFVMNFFIGIIVAIYVMADKDIFCAQMKKMLYGFFDKKKANKIMAGARYADKVFGGFINGKIIDSIIIGIICYILMMILHLPYPILISVIVGFTNIIPFFGPFIGAIPSALLILMVDPVKCLIFVILIMGLQQLDGNVIGPMIIGDSTGLSSFWVMFAILIFGGVYGVGGMILGVPIFACIYMLLKIIVSNLLKKKKLPVETEEYKNIYEISNDSDVITTVDEFKQKEAIQKKEMRMKKRHFSNKIHSLLNKKKTK